MKKIVTKQIEVEACDNCGKELSFCRGDLLEKCALCGKDMCSNCRVDITSIKRRETICVAHLPVEIVGFLNRDV